MRKTLTKRIPLLFMTLLLTMSVSRVYVSFIRIDLDFVSMLLTGLLAVALAELITWNKWTAASSGVLVLLHVICSLAEVPVLHSLATDINACAWDTYMKVFWTDRTPFENEFGTILLISFAICLSIHVVYTKLRSAALSAILLMVYIFFMEFYRVGTQTQVMWNLLFMVVALLVLYAHRWYYNGETKQKRKLTLRYGLPLLCSILILSLLLTSVIDTNPNKQFQHWLEQRLYHLSVGNMPDIKLPKFNQSVFEKTGGALGGNISLSNRHLFSVTVTSEYGEALRGQSVYLRGVACDYFENDTWHTAIDDGKERLLTDYFAENIYFCSDGRASFIQDEIDEETGLYQQQRFVVSYDEMQSETIFNHILTTGILAYGVNENAVYYDNSTYTYHKEDANWYEVSYVALDRDSAALRDFVDHSTATTYANAAMSAELKNQIQTYYLQMPSDLSDSVSTLAERLTDAYDNDYDKAAAIESYLKANYTYTLQPGDVPKDKNLVEYFLFESQKGYCVYFASSMVMLCRSVGIPARYVKGYRADGLVNGETISVKESDSHAWVEVFLPNLGWVTFDPVSSADFQQNGQTNAPNRQSPSPGTQRPTPTKTPFGTTPPPTNTPAGATPTTEGATPESAAPETMTPQSAVPDTPTTSPATPKPPRATTATRYKDDTVIVWIIGIMGLLLLLAAAFFLWKRHSRAAKKTVGVRQMHTAAVRIYQRIICVYTFLGQPPEVGETVAQYVGRLENPDLKAMVPVLEDCFYHQGIMKKEQYKAFVTALRQVELRAIKEKGQLKWKWFRWNFRRNPEKFINRDLHSVE